MADTEPNKKVRSRRSHRKSRLGCKNCKRRRLKCDEQKPSCNNCLVHSIECDFILPSEADYSASGSPATDSASSAHQFRFKKSKFQSLIGASADSEVPANISSKCAGVQCNLWVSDSRSGSISIADLDLYHHYITSTYRTLAHEQTDTNQVFLIHVPRWGLAFPSILHLMLALSALHLGHKNPDMLFEYRAQADDHFTFGVRSVTAVLSQINAENCQMIYMAATLVCFVYFGRGPRTGEYLVFSESGKSEWLFLMRGVRSIVLSERERIFIGILEPQDEGTPKDVIAALQPELSQHQEHVEMVRGLIKESIIDKNVLLMYLDALDDLLRSLDEAFRVRSAGRHGVCLMAAAIGWIYRLKEEFVQLLEAKDPYTLIILAHWSILLKYMESSWLMIGWHSHVISGIMSSLDSDFQGWIEWPVSFLHN